MGKSGDPAYMDRDSRDGFEEAAFLDNDPLEKLDQFSLLIELVLDLAQEIARTETDIDDKTIILIRRIVNRLLGGAV